MELVEGEEWIDSGGGRLIESDRISSRRKENEGEVETSRAHLLFLLPLAEHRLNLSERPQDDVAVEMRDRGDQEVEGKPSQKSEGGRVGELEEDEEDIPRQGRRGTSSGTLKLSAKKETE